MPRKAVSRPDHMLMLVAVAGALYLEPFMMRAVVPWRRGRQLGTYYYSWALFMPQRL